MRKPVDITFWLNDIPPASVLLSSAVQQAALIVVLLYPAIIVGRELQATATQAAGLLSLSLIAAAAGTIMQSLGRWGIGSGYLAPASASVVFIGPALLAAEAGGLPMVAGMMASGGVAMILLARVLQPLRGLLPPEIAGVVAFTTGMAVALAGVRMLARTPEALSFLVALLTLLVAVGLSVWGRGMVRWTCVLIALVVGTLAAALLDRLDLPAGHDLGSVPLVGLPDIAPLGVDFDITLLPVFLVVALASALKTVGLVTTLQKVNDADWVRAEPRSIAGGVSGEGAAMLVSGLIGAVVPATISTTSIAAQSATGITSRIVGYVTAALCLLLACFPRAAAVLSLVPGPVIAAILLQTGGLMLASGMQLATSRMLDTRKSLAVGLAVVTALAVETVPQAAQWVPPAMRPLMSAVALGTLVAILLNALLRIGVRQEVTLTVPADAVPEREVADFVTRAGASWGARHDVVAQTSDVIAWSLEAITGAGLARGDITLRIGFDEFRIDVVVAYAGAPIVLSQAPPTVEQMLEDEDAPARLAGHLVRRRASRAQVRHRGGMTELRLHLEH